MLLIIYSLFNMNDVSWGTRENPPDPAAAAAATATGAGGTSPNGQATAADDKELTKTQRLMKYLGATTPAKEEGAIDFSFAGLFRCMLCTHPRDNSETVHLLRIADQLKDINQRLDDFER